jgi:DNA-directed RNA polymerase specialized sigma subunit
MIIDNYQLIKKAKKGNKGAMTVLIKQFYPLLKREARKFQYMGLEFDDAFQQAALLFITGVYQYQEVPPVTFAGFIKKRIKWGLWGHWRKTKLVSSIGYVVSSKKHK